MELKALLRRSVPGVACALIMAGLSIFTVCELPNAIAAADTSALVVYHDEVHE